MDVFLALLFQKLGWWLLQFLSCVADASVFTFLTLFFLQIMRILADDKYHTFQNLQQLFRYY